LDSWLENPPNEEMVGKEVTKALTRHPVIKKINSYIDDNT
jgi:hypothetical protein